MLICLSGLMNFVQSGLDALTHGPLDGNPALINIAMAVLGTILSVALSAYIGIASWNYHELRKGEDDHRENGVAMLETVEEEEG